MCHAEETRDKEARNSREKDKKSKQIWRRAAFFVLGYFCPVLNEIRVYPRLYLLVRPQLIPYIQENLFPEFNAQVAKAKLRSWGGGGGEDWERKDSQNGYKNREPTYYHKLSFHHKLSQTLHNIW